MTSQSLETALAEAGGPLASLRKAPFLPGAFPGLVPEFTNWRSEQHVWREGTALLDQSHHMTDLFLSGPGAFDLLRDLAVNSFAKFAPGKAKQFVATNPDGFVIGDAVLFYLDDEVFDLVGHPFVLEWVQYHVETGTYDVTSEWDRNSAVRQGPPKEYRYEIQGPTADAALAAATGSPLPDVKFFNMTDFTIAGHRVRGLRHGMAGQPGYELWGPWAEGADVMAALLAAGAEHGMQRVGWRAYTTANLESAWIPTPLPAIYTGDGMEAYRKWRTAEDLDSLGGSMDSAEIEDYYVTPYDLGYGKLVVFDHDFVGRDALEKISAAPHRHKVSLVWNAEDFAAAAGSLLTPDQAPAKFIDTPKARYARFMLDKVVAGGRTAGMAFDHGYLSTDQVFLSLATVDEQFAEPGTELTLVWGESPSATRPQVERHRQIEIRVTVAPAPYSSFARTGYRKS